jgi:hypothetical protein
MTFCHGSCASAHRSIYDDSIVGTPSFYNQKSGGPDELTPCGLRTFHHLVEAESHACCQQ